jgi:hypothetical protein
LFDWGTLDDLIDAAQMAEASGYFESVWVGDNLLSKPRVESIVTLSALATRTEHVRLGTICLASKSGLEFERGTDVPCAPVATTLCIVGTWRDRGEWRSAGAVYPLTGASRGVRR